MVSEIPTWRDMATSLVMGAESAIGIQSARIFSGQGKINFATESALVIQDVLHHLSRLQVSEIIHIAQIRFSLS